MEFGLPTRIMAVAKDGGTPRKVVDINNPCHKSSYDFAVDGKFIYYGTFLTDGDTTCGDVLAAIMKVPRGGGEPVVLTARESMGIPRSIAVSGGFVYSPTRARRAVCFS